MYTGNRNRENFDPNARKLTKLDPNEIINDFAIFSFILYVFDKHKGNNLNQFLENTFFLYVEVWSEKIVCSSKLLLLLLF